MSNLSHSVHSRATPEGRDALELFQLSPDLLHLNHGSYGAVPKVVRDEQDRWRARIESNATGFFRDELRGELRRLAGIAAERFGGDAGGWVFCENATQAVNSVLASFGLKAGDEILTTSHAYGAVTKAMTIWALRFGARVVNAPLPAIVEDEDAIVDAIARAFSDRTKLLIVDHITSATATVFPVRRIVKAAKERGIAVLVDGAHAPGQLPLDVEEVGADWYTGNAHKWLFAPKGCGLLWTAPGQREKTRPVVLSHGAPDGYTEAFDWIGTRDVTPWLCFEAAARFHDSLGGEALMTRNRLLAAEAAEMISSRRGSRPSAPASLRAAMACLTLPRPGVDPSAGPALMRALRDCCNAIVPAYVFGGALCFRISAQIYNETRDYEDLAQAIPVALQQIGLD